MAVSVGAAGMRQLRTSDIGNGGNHFPRHTQAPGLVVSHDVVGDQPEERRQRSGSPTSAGIGKLQDGLDVVAQAEASHGSPGPRPTGR